MKLPLVVALLVALTGLAAAQSLSGAVCVVKAKIPGCNACDPPVPPTPAPTKLSKSKQIYTCTACGSAKGAYDPLYDADAKRCPCAAGFGQSVDVSALLAAAQDTTTYPSKDQRKAFAKQAGTFKLKFVGGRGGVCMPCPATDLLGQTYAAPGGLASVCAPVVV